MAVAKKNPMGTEHWCSKCTVPLTQTDLDARYCTNCGSALVTESDVFALVMERLLTEERERRRKPRRRS